MAALGPIDLVTPLAESRRRDSRLRIADALRSHGDDIAGAWLRLAVVEGGRGQFGLDRQLRSLISGLIDVFAAGDWTVTQAIIDNLAERRARREVARSDGFQRAIIQGRHAIRPFIGAEDHELLLEALHECVFRYYESYQGIRMATENDRMHTRIIRSLVMALEARDPYTKGHSISVALLCERIAHEIDDVDPHRAYLAGLLHDVGKVGIPDRILGKRAPLSDEEWVIMRGHPVMGANILSPIKLYSDVVDGVLAHHENWDGTGYPTGLGEEDIPVLGRMIRVVDSFDAMTSTRAFRSGRGMSEAISEIEDLAGLTYDPRLVKVVTEVVGQADTMRDLSIASLQIDLSESY